MAFNYHKDGRCSVCKLQTNDSCDSCERFLCDQHRLHKGDFFFCRECFEKGAKPLKRRPKLNEFRDW